MDIFDPDRPFEEKVVDVFRYQAQHNRVYRTFVETLGLTAENPPSCKEIPLLPIRAFKEAEIVTGKRSPKLVFKSSGTSEMVRSVHLLADPELYNRSVRDGFDLFYSDRPSVWAYTPGYQENPDSSLVHMLQVLMDRDTTGMSRFLPVGEPLDLREIEKAEKMERPVVLFGAAFGWMDLVTKHPVSLPENWIVIETGGMKTHRREIGRRELHESLAEGFCLPIKQIHSEYGMCEMLSQSYAQEEGWFESVPWLQVSVRDPENPGRICPPGEEGLIGMIDLANLHSCSFILTEDRGVMDPNGRFNVLGRWNPENLRGCNFLIDRD